MFLFLRNSIDDASSQLRVFAYGPADFKYIILVLGGRLIGILPQNRHEDLERTLVVDRWDPANFIIVLFLFIELQDIIQITV